VETLTYIILVPMVYMAVVVFVAGSLVRLMRIWRAPANPVSLQIYPQRKPSLPWVLVDTFFFLTVRRHRPLLWVALMVFHGCLVLLVIGHLELFRPFALFQVVPHEVFLGRGWVGLAMILCLLYFLFRRFHGTVRELSVPEDYYLLVLLLLTALFGSQMDWARTWYGYGELMVDDYRQYLLSLLFLKPELPMDVLDSGHSFMLVLHVFFANLLLMALPFSQLMHAVFSLPMNKLRRG
jgi:nitrate reductase gamma subunit